MAATGFTPISLYYSTTASAVPTAGNLANGELALNTADMKLYAKNSSGTVTLLASNASSSATVSSVAMTVPAFLSVSGSPVTSSGTLAVTLSGTALPVANGGTGTTTAFTAGSVVFAGASGTYSQSNAQLFWDNTNSRLGIGTAAPGQKFVVSGGRSNLYANSETYALGVGYSSSTGLYYIGATNSATPDLVFSQVGGSERARITNAGGFSVGTTSDPGAGAIYATGNITAYFSDDRLKTRLGKIENALDKVGQLNGFYYQPNETAQALGYKVKREVGVSAQEVQAVLPEIVSPAPIDEQYMTIDYERLVPLLIEAIKELRAEVKALKGA